MKLTDAEAKELFDDRILPPDAAFWIEHAQCDDQGNEVWEIKERSNIRLYPLDDLGQPMLGKYVHSHIDYDVCTCYDEGMAKRVLSLLRNADNVHENLGD